MSVSRLLRDSQAQQVVTHAIDRSLPVTLTHRTVDGWHLRKTRSHFASGAPASNTIGVDMDLPADVPPSSLPGVGDPVGLTFRLNRYKCVFNSVVRAVERRGSRLSVTIRWPEELQQIQRRAFERAPVPVGTVIPVRFWQDDPGCKTSGCERDIRLGQLEDLSAGGLRIKVAQSVEVRIGSTYKCVFSVRAGAPALIVDARLRHREVAEQDRSLLGMQLIGLETTLEGRRLIDHLAEVVAQFQRLSRRAGGFRRIHTSAVT